MRSKYVADFETTGEKYRAKHGITKVWLWGITKWKPEKDYIQDRVKVGTNISTFLRHLETLPDKSIVFFHNLSFDGYFILCSIKREIDAGIVESIEHLTSDTMTIYSMKIYFKKGKTIRFQCTNLLFAYTSISKMGELLGRPKLEIEYNREEYNPTDKDIKYLEEDILILRDYLTRDYHSKFSKMNAKRIKLTSPSFAVDYFKKAVGRELYDYLWKGHMEVKEWDLFKNYSYFGGMSLFKEEFREQELKDLKYYDVNSLYPFSYGTNPMPYGRPLEKRPHEQHLEISFYHITSFKKKFDMFDMCNHLHLKTHPNPLVRGLRYGEEGVYKKLVIGYWKEEWEEILKTYDIQYKVLKTYYFKTTTALMLPTLELYKHRVSLEDEVEKKNVKDVLNSFYGKHAQARVFQRVSFDDNMRKILTPEETTDPMRISYIPLASYIAARSRVHMLKQIRENRHLWVYTDTDSMVLMKGEHKVDVDSKRLGAFKKEFDIKTFKYLRAKTYLLEQYNGKKKLVACGSNGIDPTKISFEEFKGGMTTEIGDGKKLANCRYKDGYVLRDVPWSVFEYTNKGFAQLVEQVAMIRQKLGVENIKSVI